MTTKTVTPSLGQRVIGGAMFGLVYLLIRVLEGFSVYANMNEEKFKVGPYLNVFGVDFCRDRSEDRLKSSFSPSFGAKFQFIIQNKITIGGFGEIRASLSNGQSEHSGTRIGTIF